MGVIVSIRSHHFFRYFDVSRGEVVDEFLDTHEVGHEPADVQVKHIMETLEKANIPAAKMICFSRDNPTVMQKTARLLTEAIQEANCPKLVDLPCLLHPTHTSFKEAVKVMDKSIVQLLGQVHTFFKTSAARREDLVDLREDMAERLQDQFDEVLNRSVLCWSTSKSCSILSNIEINCINIQLLPATCGHPLARECPSPSEIPRPLGLYSGVLYGVHSQLPPPQQQECPKK